MSKARSNFTEIPVVDISGLYSDDPAVKKSAAAELDRAARDVGFLFIKGHRIPDATSEGLKAAAKRFFDQPFDKKMDHYIGKSKNHRGYVPRGEEQFNGYNDDLKEAYDTARDLPANDPDFLAGNRMLGPNEWPDDVPGFKEQVSAYYEAVMELGNTLLSGFETGLGLPEGRLLQYINKPTSQLRLIHYWEVDSLKEVPADRKPMGIGAHTDYECFTILLPTAPGLQVLNGDGEWIEAVPQPGCLVINIGDMLEAWTNGLYVATTHRVRQVKQERYSFPLFFATDYDTVVEPLAEFCGPDNPPEYPALRAGDHLVAQTMQTFTYLIEALKEGTAQLPDGSLGTNQFGRFDIEKPAAAE